MMTDVCMNGHAKPQCMANYESEYPWTESNSKDPNSHQRSKHLKSINRFGEMASSTNTSSTSDASDLSSIQCESSAYSFWDVYNSEDSVLPFVVPLLVWLSSYLYCQFQSKPLNRLQSTINGCPAKVPADRILWCEWHALHNVHNMGAVLLGLMSVWLNNDELLNERIGILWSLSYFCVDLVDTASRRDIPFVLHAVCCLGLGTFNYTNALCRLLRMNSKAAQLELSSPLLHLAKSTRNPIYFGLFALVFTCCRILWVPVMMHQLHDHGMPWTDPILVGVMVFYALNLYWYAKILRLLLQGLGLLRHGDKEE